jgi:hypothetical protein
MQFPVLEFVTWTRFAPYDAGVADANLIFFLPQPLGLNNRSVLDTMCGVDARHDFRMHEVSKVPNG